MQRIHNSSAFPTNEVVVPPFSRPKSNFSSGGTLPRSHNWELGKHYKTGTSLYRQGRGGQIAVYGCNVFGGGPKTWVNMQSSVCKNLECGPTPNDLVTCSHLAQNVTSLINGCNWRNETGDMRIGRHSLGSQVKRTTTTI